MYVYIRYYMTCVCVSRVQVQKPLLCCRSLFFDAVLNKNVIFSILTRRFFSNNTDQGTPSNAQRASQSSCSALPTPRRSIFPSRTTLQTRGHLVEDVPRHSGTPRPSCFFQSDRARCHTSKVLSSCTQDTHSPTHLFCLVVVGRAAFPLNMGPSRSSLSGLRRNTPIDRRA